MQPSNSSKRLLFLVLGGLLLSVLGWPVVFYLAVVIWEKLEPGMPGDTYIFVGAVIASFTSFLIVLVTVVAAIYKVVSAENDRIVSEP